MKNCYYIEIEQKTLSVLTYKPSGSVFLGTFFRPKKDVLKYANLIKRLLGAELVKVTVHQQNIDILNVPSLKVD